MTSPYLLPPKKIWIDHTSIIETDIDTLSALLSDIDHWPDWTPGLCSIKRRSKGLAKAGTFFLMTLKAPVIQKIFLPAVMVQNDKHHIEWGGGALGSHIRHSMTLTEIDEKNTKLHHIEYATGLLAILSWPAADFAHQHDMRWSKAIEAKFKRS